MMLLLVVVDVVARLIFVFLFCGAVSIYVGLGGVGGVPILLFLHAYGVS